MAYQFDPPVHYAAWVDSPQGKRILGIEEELALRLIEPQPGTRVLDVGCGPGHFMATLKARGLLTTGLDSNAGMIELARRRLGDGAELHVGDAGDLPFEDDTFDLTVLNTVLEFVPDPEAALMEAVRVTLGQIYVGVLNRYSMTNLTRRAKAWWRETPFTGARFFGPWEIVRLVKGMAGGGGVNRATVFSLPLSALAVTEGLERSTWCQKSPFGAYIGLAATVKATTRTANVPIDGNMRQRAPVIAEPA